RRHTRFSRDWSSDVCSSDLAGMTPEKAKKARKRTDGLVIENDGSASLPALLGDSLPLTVAALRPGAPTYVATAQGVGQLPSWHEIGRASCRESVDVSAGPGA